MTRVRSSMTFRLWLLIATLIAGLAPLRASADQKVWKPVQFAIVGFSEDAPKSWNIYHGEKRGVLLVRLWKRYMLVDVKEQEEHPALLPVINVPRFRRVLV